MTGPLRGRRRTATRVLLAAALVTAGAALLPGTALGATDGPRAAAVQPAGPVPSARHHRSDRDDESSGRSDRDDESGSGHHGDDGDRDGGSGASDGDDDGFGADSGDDPSGSGEDGDPAALEDPDAHGGAGGAAGENSTQCDLPLGGAGHGQGCQTPPAQDGPRGPDHVGF